MRIRLQPLPVMSLCAVAALITLIVLGAWQWRRYDEKRLLSAAPALEVALSPSTPIPGATQLVFGVRAGAPGWRVFEAVRYGERAVFVDTGFVPGPDAPDWRTLPPSRALEETRALAGVSVTPRRPTAIAAKGDPARRLWYAVDLEGMARAAGLGAVEPFYVALPYVSAAGSAEPNPFALGARADPLPPERHLGYAFTWWGLAASLVGVYLAYHARLGRLVIR